MPSLFLALWIGADGAEASPRPAAKSQATQATPASAQRPGRFRRALEWTERQVGRIHLPARWRRGIDRKLKVAGGYCTAMADKVERKLPKRLRPAFGKARNLSPASLASYCTMKFKQDPAFLTAWGAGYGVLHKLEAPLMMACGVSPGLAIGLQEGFEIPVNLCVIALRQHRLRADKSQSFAGTLRLLGREYSQHTQGRREDNRRFMKERAAKSGSAPAPSPALALPGR